MITFIITITIGLLITFAQSWFWLDVVNLSSQMNFHFIVPLQQIEKGYT
jgi:hypothetical protein